MYIIIKYKNIQNIKKWLRPPPPGGGGVWYDTLAVNLEPLLVRWHHCVLNKYRGSCPRGQSLLRYQPVCLWYHYICCFPHWLCSRNLEKGHRAQWILDSTHSEELSLVTHIGWFGVNGSVSFPTLNDPRWAAWYLAFPYFEDSGWWPWSSQQWPSKSWPLKHMMSAA